MPWYESAALATYTGQTSAFPTTYTGWVRIQVGAAGTASAIRMYVRGLGAGSLRLGLYNENPATNTPATLLDWGIVTPTAMGYAYVTLGTTPAVLLNEYVWVGWQVSVDAATGHQLAYVATATTDRYRSNVGYTDGLPASAGTTYANAASWYAAVYVGTGASTSTSTTTSTSTSTSTTSTSVSTSTTQSTSTSTSTTSTSVSTSTTSTSVSTSISTTTSSSTSTSTSLTLSTSSSTSVSTTSSQSTSTSRSTSTSTLRPLDDIREVCDVEHDVILVPDTDDSGDYAYRHYSVLNLFGITARMLRSYANFGMPPLHFITQRSPYQDGQTALDMRLDPRVVQVSIAEPLYRRMDFWDRRADILDLLRPNRSFDDVVRPLIYQKWLPSGKLERGTDLATTSWSNTVTSITGRFVERGLEAGDRFDIMTGADVGVATVASVPNDYTVILTAPVIHTATGVRYRFRRGRAKRNLYCLLEQGPKFDEGPGATDIEATGYKEVLRFVANDPCWYSDVTLTQAWSTAMTALGDLVFDGTGAWFAENAGVAGRWLFNITYVGAPVDVIYWGTARARPTITIAGPAENPRIENHTTGTYIEMDYNIALGETVIIDTLALTVENGSGVNLLPYTTGDLATFGLEPAPQAPDRVNSLSCSFSGATLSSAATLTWRNRYIGI